jgi:MFS superfamily sulfate permease-like transporter
VIFLNQIILWGLFIGSWFTLFFIGKKHLKRFLPVALFVTVINTIIYQAAYHYNWWREMALFEWDKFANIPWVYSSYLVATIWIFRFTYGRFIIYMITNLLLDGGYIYVWYPIQQKLGMASGEMSPHTTLAIMTGVSVIIYLFQVWYEKDLES